MATVQIRQLTKRFGSTAVVRDVDLDIADGELLAVVGPSGCGKSTLLRMIAGLDEPTAGTIHVDGVSPADRRPGRSPVAMMFQEAALYPHLDVRGNLAFPLRLAGARPPDIRREIADVAAMLGIGRLLSRRPHQLSGGQRQRVAMARSLIRRPGLLLMDEPMSNLDAKLRGELRAAIGHLHQRRGMTMVYVTHDQVEAMSLGDRIAVMRHGRIVQIGSPHDVYHRPADVTVATFVGVPTMNLLAGRLLPGTDAAVLEVGGVSLSVRRQIGSQLPFDAARDVVIGVRPQAIRFADRGLLADVEHTEILGDRCLVTATVPAVPAIVTEQGLGVGSGPPRVTVDTAVADAHGERRWQPSHLAIDVDDLHLFDPATGRSLATATDGTTADQPTRATSS